jgi:hypothetical protein
MIPVPGFLAAYYRRKILAQLEDDCTTFDEHTVFPFTLFHAGAYRAQAQEIVIDSHFDSVHSGGASKPVADGDDVACGLAFAIWEVRDQGTRVLPVSLSFWLHTMPPTWRALWRLFTGNGFDLSMRLSLGGPPDKLTKITQPLLDFVANTALHDACLAFFQGLKEDKTRRESA